MSFFDAPNEPPTDGVQAADDRTLRLSAYPLTEKELAALIRYQETFLAVAEPGGGADVLSRAHAEALKTSGLPGTKPVEMGSALLRNFAGQRWAVSKLRDKLKQLESQGPEADELRSRIQDELRRLDRTDNLVRRYGEATVSMLLRHEEKLIALHTRMTKVLSQK